MQRTVHPDTGVGPVALTVSDLPRALAFYQRSLGFHVHAQADGTAYLGGESTDQPGRDILVLTERRDARKAPGTSGLYHFAVRLPSRQELARVLQRLVETRTPLQGFADHLVSEAIYLADPDGNGIEVYCDRPRQEWQYAPDGSLRMATDPLDLEGLWAELDSHPDGWPGLHSQTRLGHMHLHVASIAEAEAFYHDILGFDLVLRYGPTASFFSAGGYHHHVGVNTWAGVEAPPAPAGAVGLRWFAIHLPDAAELQAVVEQVRAAGVGAQESADGFLVNDPSGNGILLTTAAQRVGHGAPLHLPGAFPGIWVGDMDT